MAREYKAGTATDIIIGSDAGTVTIGGANTAIVMTTGPAAPSATVAATGSAIGNAAQLSYGFTFVTGADATKGVKLPAGVAGRSCKIKNDEAANAILKVYPTANAQINVLTANAAISMAANTAAEFFCYTANQWYTIPFLPS